MPKLGNGLTGGAFGPCGSGNKELGAGHACGLPPGAADGEVPPWAGWPGGPPALAGCAGAGSLGSAPATLLGVSVWSPVRPRPEGGGLPIAALLGSDGDGEFSFGDPGLVGFDMTDKTRPN